MGGSDYTDQRANSLAGRTALVTGGARRLGAVICRRLGSLGARVIVHYHTSESDARALVAELPSGGLAVGSDLSRPDGAEALFSELDRARESPDLLVHAAAGFVRADLEESDAAVWDEVLALNLRSFALLARELRRRRGSRGGDLVAIADAAALELWPGFLAHSVSKAGLLALVKALAKGLAPSYRVNAVLPGPVLPPEGTPPERVALYERRTLLERLGEPSDVASAVEFLLTCPFATGSVVHVTGGSELWRGRP